MLRNLSLAAALVLLAGCIHGQLPTNLPTPVVVLPKADHSAAGQLIFYDLNKANPVTLEEFLTNSLRISNAGNDNRATVLITSTNAGATAKTLTLIAPASDLAATIFGKVSVTDGGATGTAVSILTSNAAVQGLQVVTANAIALDVQTGGLTAIQAKGDIIPFADNATNIGSGARYWKNVLSYSLTTKNVLSQCLQTDGGGIITGSGVATCGGPAITQLTGDVTAGPGSGSVAASVVRVAGVAVNNNTLSSSVGDAPSWNGGSWEFGASGYAGVVKTAWPTYTPVFTNACGAITVSSVQGGYLQVGKIVHLRIYGVITSIGTACPILYVTLPIAPITIGGSIWLQTLAVSFEGPSGPYAASGHFENTFGSFQIDNLAFANFPTATAFNIAVSGTYEAN